MRQLLAVDFDSQQRNHSVDNPELKADKPKLPVARKGAVINSTLLSADHGAQFCPQLLTGKIPAAFGYDGVTLNQNRHQYRGTFVL